MKTHSTPKDDADSVISAGVDHNSIATLAYQLWTDRGCPAGSPEDDWFRAENKLSETNRRGKNDNDLSHVFCSRSDHVGQ